MQREGRWPYFVQHVHRMELIWNQVGKPSKKPIRKAFRTDIDCKMTDIFYSYLYMRSFVADGNFKADHLKQKNDLSDVWLTNGEAFLPTAPPHHPHPQTPAPPNPAWHTIPPSFLQP